MPRGEVQSRRPGRQIAMNQKPKTVKASHIGTGKLKNKVALITGGDSGIGRAVAVAFAREGADIAIGYLNEEKDARASPSSAFMSPDIHADLQRWLAKAKTIQWDYKNIVKRKGILERLA